MNWLRIEDVSVDFTLKESGAQALRALALAHIDLTLEHGDSLGLVGESGSGKSTLGRVISQLLKPSHGRVVLDGVDLTALNNRELRPHRQKMQMVFQDAYSAMNPRMTIGQIVGEPLRLQGLSATDRRDRVITLLERIGLAIEMSQRYPHELSGGQLQRVALARALATKPELLVLDEPTSGLDVSIQARILNLLRELRKESGLGLIFISHDLAAVSYLAQRIAVLYLGHLVEVAPTETLIARPAHPYSAALLAALPSLMRKNRADRSYSSLPTRGIEPPQEGCVFQDRCPFAQARCRLESPALIRLSLGHQVACHHPLG